MLASNYDNEFLMNKEVKKMAKTKETPKTKEPPKKETTKKGK